MGLFSRTKRRLFADYKPLVDPTEDEIVEGLAQGLAGRPCSLTDRNDWANALLAWAEEQGTAKFNQMRHLMMQREFAVNARDWVERFSDETTELGVLKQAAVMDHMARQGFGYRGDNFEEAFGPDLPKIIAAAYSQLVEAKGR